MMKQLKSLVTRANFALTTATVTLVGWSTAHAQVAGGVGGAGGIDPGTALTTAFQYGLPIGGTVIAGQCMKNAIEAHHQGQGLARHVFNGLGAMALGFGGSTLVTRLGGTVGGG